MVLEQVPTVHAWDDAMAAPLVPVNTEACMELLRWYHGQIWTAMSEREQAGMAIYYRNDFDQSAYLNHNWASLTNQLRRVTSAMRRFL